ncbi:ATPase associated with various cellular activities AAA_3 [Ferrimonas balearica DSM 9799]|uniref:ATPase associated with various cellular activities AAA_3 n=1 Tax=Ferrimonas balearica (strain DSM 9799 / CCM 4581 / KCTC 23876 / PAT) TaxID=550540 RepID=E1SQ63_FERBD|nr:MoxR family ATPase [Ferrimonas balearica]MBY6017320.1 MoxR family ATPase [Halomonas denitrificans]ADN76835.1 ATPase associated with various cellular activities AAA_3 [Ferrimonas balearica DSM 9799]MBW3140180.1 MoxR family ATPase [Ferrimonas balearica]MBW3165200.1 MoxR family ATPase [Ferrimonas balearica]MBY6093596.1 MoxR family ATPase [Ferrimonas balearica]
MQLERLNQIQHYLQQMVLGQPALVEGLLIALIADGHLLVEGPPGLAKTRAVKALADCIQGNFHRVQFTPDLLPADLTGTDIFRQETGQFEFQPGPLFHNLILADEINRAPAKVQSALLEAMAEGQITVGKRSYPLPKLFLVMATQNPIENEGTYPLPEAQLDRFLLHLALDYPNAETERQILALSRNEAMSAPLSAPEPLSEAELFSARRQALDLYLAPQLEGYMVELVMATRTPARYDETLANWIQWGVSPRATIALERCARARAWICGRDYVAPEDIQAVAPNVLRHRILLSYQAEAEGVNADQVIHRILKLVAVP